MKWNVVRLELASSWEFPRGSVGRSYLIRLPLDDDGVIDTSTLESQPTRATVRRYWANEPDMTGHLVQTPLGFAIRYEASAAAVDGGPGDGNLDPLITFGSGVISIGDEIVLTEPDGRQIRLLVVSQK